MQQLVEDFLQYLRHERGQSDHTQKTYAALLNKFVAFARARGLRDWKTVEPGHIQQFLEQERERSPANQPEDSPKKLSSASVYLEIAALRAFYKFCESER